MSHVTDGVFCVQTSERNLATEPFDSGDDLPSRRTDVDFDSLSTTRGGEPGNEGLNRCGPNAPVEFWTTSGNDSGNEGENADAKTSIGWSEERAKVSLFLTLVWAIRLTSCFVHRVRWWRRNGGWTRCSRGVTRW